MKQLIRILAKWYGIEKDIRSEERNVISQELQGASYWFTSRKKYGSTYPFLFFISESIKNNYVLSGHIARESYDRLARQMGPDKTESWGKIKYNKNLNYIDYIPFNAPAGDKADKQV